MSLNRRSFIATGITALITTPLLARSVQHEIDPYDVMLAEYGLQTGMFVSYTSNAVNGEQWIGWLKCPQDLKDNLPRVLSTSNPDEFGGDCFFRPKKMEELLSWCSNEKWAIVKWVSYSGPSWGMVNYKSPYLFCHPVRLDILSPCV